MNWEKLLSAERIRKSSKNPNDIRNEFESDFGRIIFSPALRRMHDKTQVFPLTANDNIHSRLTHSNEVMSIGYTFGLKLSSSKIIQDRTKKNEAELLRILPVILKNVCLIHDIGNAPFGHFGETVISDYFRNILNEHFNTLTEEQKIDFTDYDGNAQGLRVISKLQYLNDIYGLNLTYATLGAYLKYPNIGNINKQKKEQSKHGIFYSEKEFFEKIVDACGLKSRDESILRHPLAYLMEASDSIAYSIMDIEDGFNTGLLSISDIDAYFKKRKDEIDKELINSNKSNPDILTRIISICTNTNKNYKDNSKIVNIRIALMNHLVELAYRNFEKYLDRIESGEYNQELIEDDQYKVAEVLQNLCVNKIFKSRGINYLETTGYSIFIGLLDYYIKFLFHKDIKFRRRAQNLISESIIECAIEENIDKTYINRINRLKDQKSEISDTQQIKKIEEKINTLENSGVEKSVIEYDRLMKQEGDREYNELDRLRNEIREHLKPEFDDLDNYYKFRVILDFISGMTDNFALNHYNNISGQSIN